MTHQKLSFDFDRLKTKKKPIAFRENIFLDDEENIFLNICNVRTNKPLNFQ